MTHLPDHEVELYRDEDAYVVIVDLPGYDRSSLDVRWHDGRLHVHAENSADGRSKVFTRNVTLPYAVDADAISASYEEDVLEVRLPLLAEERSPGTRINVS